MSRRRKAPEDLLPLEDAYELYAPVVRDFCDKHEVRGVDAHALVNEIHADIARANHGKVPAVDFDRYLTAVATRIAKQP